MGNSRDQMADEAFEALFQIFLDPKRRSYARFRCPIDGPPSGFDAAFGNAMTEMFGPNVEYQLWLNKLRKNGLISW